MPRGAFTAARHFSFDDAVLASGAGVTEYRDLKGGVEFKPQAIIVNSSSDTDEDDAGYCTIRGYLFGENATFIDTYVVNVRQPVGLAFRAIYSNGTTARGIKLLSEI